MHCFITTFALEYFGVRCNEGVCPLITFVINVVARPAAPSQSVDLTRRHGKVRTIRKRAARRARRANRNRHRTGEHADLAGLVEGGAGIGSLRGQSVHLLLYHLPQHTNFAAAGPGRPASSATVLLSRERDLGRPQNTEGVHPCFENRQVTKNARYRNSDFSSTVVEEIPNEPNHCSASSAS